MISVRMLAYDSTPPRANKYNNSTAMPDGGNSYQHIQPTIVTIITIRWPLQIIRGCIRIISNSRITQLNLIRIDTSVINMNDKTLSS